MDDNTIKDFFCQFQAIPDSVISSGQFDFSTLSIPQCEVYLTYFLQIIIRIMNNYAEKDPEKMEAIQLILTMTRVDEGMTILHKMGKLQGMIGAHPISEGGSKYFKKGFLKKSKKGQKGGANCREPCRSDRDCYSRDCPTCDPGLGECVAPLLPARVPVAVPGGGGAGGNWAQGGVGSVVYDITNGRGGGGVLVPRQDDNQLLAHLRSPIQGPDDYYHTLIEQAEKRLEAAEKSAAQDNVELQQAIKAYSDLLTNQFYGILGENKKALSKEQNVETASAAVSGVAGGGAMYLAANAVNGVARSVTGHLKGLAYYMLIAGSIVIEKAANLGFDSHSQVDWTECVRQGESPFGKVYANLTQVEGRGVKTVYDYDYTTYTGNFRAVGKADCPAIWSFSSTWNRVGECTSRDITLYDVQCMEMEGYDFATLVGNETIAYLVIACFIFSSIVGIYIAKTIRLQNKALTFRENEGGLTGIITSALEAGWKGVKFATVVPFLIDVLTDSEERVRLVTLCREERVAYANDVLNLQDYIRHQPKDPGVEEKRKKCENAKGAVKDADDRLAKLCADFARHCKQNGANEYNLRMRLVNVMTGQPMAAIEEGPRQAPLRQIENPPNAAIIASEDANRRSAENKKREEEKQQEQEDKYDIDIGGRTRKYKSIKYKKNKKNKGTRKNKGTKKNRYNKYL